VRVLAARHFAIDSQKQNSPRYVATYFLNSDLPIGGIQIAELLRPTTMEATEVTTQMTFRCSPLPELEVPMINTMVTCLGSEHRKLNYTTVQLAFAATRLASDPGAVRANQPALRVWEEIRRDLWSHLQIEGSLVHSWGEAHHAISAALLDTLKNERQEMRNLLAALRTLSSGLDREPQAAGDRRSFVQTLLALVRTLDSHVERYDGEVLPSILRALFHK
jgi:hypothetical protein